MLLRYPIRSARVFHFKNHCSTVKFSQCHRTIFHLLILYTVDFNSQLTTKYLYIYKAKEFKISLKTMQLVTYIYKYHKYQPAAEIIRHLKN